MSPAHAAILVTLAVLGLVAAFGIGLAANAISGDSIGLSARPLRAGHELAPSAGARARRRQRRRADDDDLRPLDEHRVDDHHADDHHADDHDRGRRRPRRPLERRERLSGGGDSGSGRGRGRGRGGGRLTRAPARAGYDAVRARRADRAPQRIAAGPNARRDAAALARDEAALAAPAR